MNQEAFVALAEEVDRLRGEVDDLRRENADLSLKNQWLTKVIYGPRSEKTPPKQDHGDAVQEELFGVPVDAVATAEEAEAALAEKAKQDKDRRKGRGKGGTQQKQRNGGGRKPVNPSLRPVEQIVAAPAEERVAADGTALMLLGYEISEREHYIPAELVRLIIKREKWGLPDTRETAYRAPVLPAIVPKGKYTDAYIAEAMIRKYLHGMPFYRQVQDFASLGSHITLSTLCDLSQRFATFLRPVRDAIRDQVLSAPFQHLDETPLPTQDGRRFLWAAYAQRQVVFHCGGRGTKDLRSLLGLPEPPPGRDPPDEDGEPEAESLLGVIVADGFRPYDIVAETHGFLRLGCWAHVRRKFHALREDPRAADVLELINDLYRIERTAKRDIEKRRLRGADADAVSLALRQERSLPLLEQVHDQLRDLATIIDGRTPLGQAVGYACNQWPTLTPYASRGDLPIDNNAAERTVRPVVIGRKNWLFVGSEDAGEHAAVNFSIFESCRMCRVDVRAYLGHVLDAIHQGSRDFPELTPAALAQRFPTKQ